MQNVHVHFNTRNLLKLTLFFYIALTIWWIYIWIGNTTTAPINNAFGFVYGGFSLWGGIWGLLSAHKWGGRKSLMGKAILALAIGLLLQSFGQYSFWFINVFLQISVPYPGIPDIGYFGTIPFYIYAAMLLAKASGATLSLKLFKNQISAFIIPVVMLIISYVLILKNYTVDLHSPFTSFFDFGYPLGQLTYTAIAIITYRLSSKLLGGIMKTPIRILIMAFFMQFLADYSFVYFKDSFYPACFIDYIYLTAYFIMSVGMINLRAIAHQLQQK